MNIASESEEENNNKLHDSFKRFKLNDKSEEQKLGTVDEIIELKQLDKDNGGGNGEGEQKKSKK